MILINCLTHLPFGGRDRGADQAEQAKLSNDELDVLLHFMLVEDRLQRGQHGGLGVGAILDGHKRQVTVGDRVQPNLVALIGQLVGDILVTLAPEPDLPYRHYYHLLHAGIATQCHHVLR